MVLSQPPAPAAPPAAPQATLDAIDRRILKHLQEDGVIRDPYVPLIYMKLLRRND